MKKKLIVLIVLLLAAGGGAYKFVLAKPEEVKAKPKVEGSVYVLGKEFLVNLAGGRFAKVTVALVLNPKDHSTAPAGGGHGAAPAPPEGYGPMTQEAVVRAVITDELTDARADDLIDAKHRGDLQHDILEKLHKKTDVHVDAVLFTDVTVQ
jgi:flagellar basal body-associated protein FliL